jgi:hypothetical protein
VAYCKRCIAGNGAKTGAFLQPVTLVTCAYRAIYARLIRHFAIKPIERFNSEAFFRGLYNRGFASNYGLSGVCRRRARRLGRVRLASILLLFQSTRARCPRASELTINNGT